MSAAAVRKPPNEKRPRPATKVSRAEFIHALLLPTAALEAHAVYRPGLAKTIKRSP